MGVHLRAVQEAIERGVLDESIVHQGGRRLIDLELGAKEWRERAAPHRRANGEKLRERRAPEDEELDAAAVAAAEAEKLTLAEATAKRMRWAAERERLTVAKMKGELVDVAEVERRAFACARATRQALLAIPDRLSGILATIEDPAEIGRTLERELVAALDGLGEDLAERGLELEEPQEAAGDGGPRG